MDILHLQSTTSQHINSSIHISSRQVRKPTQDVLSDLMSGTSPEKETRGAPSGRVSTTQVLLKGWAKREAAWQ